MTGPVTRAAGGASVVVSSSPGPALLREWDDLVRACPWSDVAQLSGWARVRAQAGMTPLYVLAEQDGRLVGGAQVLVRELTPLGAVGYVPYGPVGARLDGVLADALADLTRRRLRMLVVQPPLGGEASTEELMARGFRGSRLSVAPGASIRIDLSQDEERLRRGLSTRLQRWTKRWGDRGVTVRVATGDDVPLVAGLLTRTALHQEFTPFDAGYLMGMYRALSPTGDLLVLVGEAHGIPVSTAVFTSCGGVLKARLVGLDRSSEALGLNVPAAIYWAAIRWGRANGFRWFDFGGIRESSARTLLSGGPVAPEDLAGPDQFKLRFGGEAYRCPPAVELIPSAVVRTGFDLVVRSRAGEVLLEHGQRLLRAGRARAGRVGGRRPTV